MITAHEPSSDQFDPDAGTDKRLTTWYAQGQSDGFGDRLLMFDNTNAPSWEILRFKPALARESRFEAALRQRVDQLAAFQHDAFPLVRPIKRLGQDDGLAVVSTYSGGAPLSEALKKPRSADFALRLIRQLVPALSTFEALAPGVAHGALTVDRIVLNAEGRLTIREHMVGAAIEALEWSAARLWSELGILVPKTSGAVKIDERTDIAQLALVVLSLMAGRRVGPDEYPDRTSELLDELTLKNHWLNPSNPAKFQSLRHWLERALQLTGQSFASVHDAQAALGDLHEYADSKAPHDELRAASRTPAKEESSSGTWSAARVLPPAGTAPSQPAASAQAPAENQAAPASDRTGTAAAREGAMRFWNGIPPSVVRAAGLVFAVLAIGEGIFIAMLLFTRPSTPTSQNVATAPAASAGVKSDIQPIPAASTPPVAVVLPTATVDPTVPEIRTPLTPAPARTGGIRVTAPIELTVLDGERVIGSTADGPVFTTAGRRQLDFVNSVVGFRVRQAVDVRAGQITPFTVTVPNGRLSINAQPWAAVWIDGSSVGETPLGDLSIVPGQHEVVFRHPQLGERRETTVVRAGAETRVSVNFQR